MGQGEISLNYRANPEVVLREEDDDGALLFNPDTNDVKVLNHSGLLIWKTCQTVQSHPAIIQTIRDHFDEVPEETVDRDVETFLASLLESGYLVKI
jgi:hypothetical protein